MGDRPSEVWPPGIAEKSFLDSRTTNEAMSKPDKLESLLKAMINPDKLEDWKNILKEMNKVNRDRFVELLERRQERGGSCLRQANLQRLLRQGR